MTAPIPTAPTANLALTAQTSQYDQVPAHTSYKGVLGAQAVVAPKAKQAEANSIAHLKTNLNKDYTRP